MKTQEKICPYSHGKSIYKRNGAIPWIERISRLNGRIPNQMVVESDEEFKEVLYQFMRYRKVAVNPYELSEEVRREMGLYPFQKINGETCNELLALRNKWEKDNPDKEGILPLRMFVSKEIAYETLPKHYKGRIPEYTPQMDEFI